MMHFSASQFYLLIFLTVSTKCEDDDNSDGDQEENWSSFDVVVEESVNPEFVYNTSVEMETGSGSGSMSMSGSGCPDKCLCYQTTVRCMLLDWHESMHIHAVPVEAEVL